MGIILLENKGFIKTKLKMPAVVLVQDPFADIMLD